MCTCGDVLECEFGLDDFGVVLVILISMTQLASIAVSPGVNDVLIVFFLVGLNVLLDLQGDDSVILERVFGQSEGMVRSDSYLLDLDVLVEVVNSHWSRERSLPDADSQLAVGGRSKGEDLSFHIQDQGMIFSARDLLDEHALEVLDLGGDGHCFGDMA